MNVRRPPLRCRRCRPSPVRNRVPKCRGLTFETLTAAVRTFALWVPITRRVVSDARQLRSYIDDYLISDLGLEIEDQVIAGSGTGENFRGILNTTGVQTLALAAGQPGTVAELDALRRAKRLVRVNARTDATAIVGNPEDVERWEITKDANEDYVTSFSGGPFNGAGGSIWRTPIVETDALPVGTAVVGDFRRAVLFDREQAAITLGTVNDDFIRNIVRILADSRHAFAVLRPAAFAVMDLTP